MSRDAVAAAPDIYTVLLENERVRVLDVRGQPGARSPLQSHPDSVMHALTEGTILVTSEAGETDRAEVKAGATFWTPASTHSIENVGADSVHFIRVELK
jgi:quercetin dioxygenase-like cupin family protein